MEKVCTRLDARQNQQEQASTSSSTLQNALAQLTADVTATHPVGSGDSFPSAGTSTALHTQNGQAAIPLGAAIPASIKGKILADEFVAFGQLLYPNTGNDYAVQIVQNTMQLNMQQRSRGIFTIDQWAQAFAIYRSIYLVGHQDQAIPLIKYGFGIRGMAKQYPSFAWRSYDEGFRQTRAITRWPWDIICHELYIKSISQAMAYDNGQRNSTTAGSSTQSARPFFRCFSHGQSDLTRPESASVATCITKPQTTAVELQVIPTQHKQLKAYQQLLQVSTPVRVGNLYKMLKGYNKRRRNYVVSGMLRGFGIGYAGPVHKGIRISRNHKSALNNHSVVSAFLNDELKLGRLAGPFSDISYADATVSPIGLIPKKIGLYI